MNSKPNKPNSQQNPPPKELIPREINVDAGTLMLIVSLAIAVPLLLAGIFSH
ncbi:hypothetical protein ACN4EG_05050 [Alkalinema pantanalense CENA528]|uniref:hypothetical protein n=1 Tax=Alkalinema pantanalense TaxID=1620705 RepID=UPI003D6EB446